MRVCIVMLVLAGLLAGMGWVIRGQHRAIRCESNLREIFAVLEMYEVENGTLPRLALFPDDPRRDRDSLRVLLERAGVGGEICVCPSSPRVIRDTGLSYLWNVQLSGKKLAGHESPVWMLVEINALSGQVPAPHAGKYHILYTDGSIVKSREPPASLNDREE